MGKSFVYIALLIMCTTLSRTVSCRDVTDDGDVERLMDDMCADLQMYRYKNVAILAEKASDLSKTENLTNEQRAVLLNSLAYARFMQMDYIEAAALYGEVMQMARCEIERLVAEVGMMHLCYRTSANREFFDYRSSALRRVRRINEEADELSDEDRERFHTARIEMAVVSLCYFANLGMEHEAVRAAQRIERELESAGSALQRIYARLMLNYRDNLSAAERARNLFRLLERAKFSQQTWLEANCKLMLSVLLRNDEVRRVVEDSVPELAVSMGVAGALTDELPLRLALAAVDDFNVYGDEYMMIEALTVSASCYTQSGNFDAALGALGNAMLRINNYYARVDSTLEPFDLYEVDDERELQRMESADVINIYECLLSVRREAGCAYAGLGDKSASDMNRNSYLDLLRTTRLNKQMESRVQAAEESASRLYRWFVAVFVVLSVVVVAMVLLNVRWRRRNVAYAADLNNLLKLCRQLMSSLPQEISDEDEVRRVVCEIIERNIGNFSGKMTFKILSKDDSVCIDDSGYSFALVQMDGNCAGVLHVTAEKPLTEEKMSMLKVVLPYIAVAVEEGRRIADIGDERLRMEQQYSSYTLYLKEHKRENVLKRVLLSVADGMRPYMNRMLYELRHLADVSRPGDNELRRLEYIAELTEIIDKHNDVLGRWIKMRRGEPGLMIESFCLDELMRIIAKSSQAFALKNIELCVKECRAVVKADKALTLFMINTLADNAGKFTEPGGKVTVEAVEGDDFVEIAVSDTGVGLSPDEVAKILNEKVYDAATIGCATKHRDKKGGGFGLMNCKGIIEKYKKTDELFAVCRMDISSVQGKGSRFSFRLPKGAVRLLVLVFMLFLPWNVSADDEPLFQTVELADSVYTCNIEGRYTDALVYAQEALDNLNEFYVQTVGGTDTLLLASGGVSELHWWRDNVFADSLTEDIYYNLLDIRNEAAVAALALKRWDIYRYNNSIYTQLYRLVHEDDELAGHYERMRSVANYRQAAVVLCVTLLLVLIVVYVVTYMRHVVMERVNSGLLLDINARMLRIAGRGREASEMLASDIAAEIYDGMHERLRVTRVSLLLREGAVSQMAFMPDVKDERMAALLERIMESGRVYVQNDGLMRALPLVVVSSGNRMVIGVLAVETGHQLNDSENTVLDLVAGYVASAAYYCMVHLAQKYRDLDIVEEEMERVKYEENLLHVRNLVMDNCLSVIKHETIYYPSRIRALVQQLIAADVPDDMWSGRVAAISELMDYYNSVFGVLSACAGRQIDETAFRMSHINMQDVAARMVRFVEKRSSRLGVSVKLQCECESVVINGDVDLIDFLFEALFEAFLSHVCSGSMRMSAVRRDGAVWIEILDSRRHLSENEITEMFVPTGDISSGGIMGFMVAKEIVRIHDECMGRRGGRIEARDSEQGLVIALSLIV